MSHLKEKKAWLAWMKMRALRDRLIKTRQHKSPLFPRVSSANAYELADRMQYDLQDMSPYGHSLVWGSEGDRFTKMWKKRNSRKTLAHRSR